jgi:hypothetical protein
MAHYHAAAGSRRPARETFGHLATFSNTAGWDAGVPAAQQLDPGPAGQPPRPGTTAPPVTPVPSGGAVSRPGDAP